MCALQTQRSAGRVPTERGRPCPRGEGQAMSPFLGRAQSSRIGPCGEDVAIPKHPLCVMPTLVNRAPEAGRVMTLTL